MWKGNWAGTSYGEDAGYALVGGGQGWEWGVGLGLVPECCGEEVVGAMVGVAVLDGDLDGLFEGDGAFRVPAVEAVAAGEAFGAGDLGCAVVLEAEGLAVAEVPCAVEVVFRAGSVDGGQGVPVDEDHVVALAEPAVLGLEDGVGDTDEVTAAGGFEVDVVACAGEIFAVSDGGVPVVLPVVDFADVGGSLAVLGVEASEVGRDAGQGDVIDGEVEVVGGLGAVIGDGEARAGGEGHLEVGVESLNRGDGDEGGLESEVFAESESEEVSDGDLDGGGGFAVPPGAEDEVFEVVRVGGVDGEPEVGDDACAGDIEDDGLFAGRDGDGVVVAAGAVPTGGAAGFVGAESGLGEEFVVCRGVGQVGLGGSGDGGGCEAERGRGCALSEEAEHGAPGDVGR